MNNNTINAMVVVIFVIFLNPTSHNPELEARTPFTAGVLYGPDEQKPERSRAWTMNHKPTNNWDVLLRKWGLSKRPTLEFSSVRKTGSTWGFEVQTEEHRGGFCFPWNELEFGFFSSIYNEPWGWNSSSSISTEVVVSSELRGQSPFISLVWLRRIRAQRWSLLKLLLWTTGRGFRF